MSGAATQDQTGDHRGERAGEGRLAIAGEALVGGTVVAAATGGQGLAEAAKGTAKIVR